MMRVEQNDQVKKICSLGKQKIVEAALQLLTEIQPDMSFDEDDYEITVWANTWSVLVKFRKLFEITVQNQPIELDRIYNVSVNVLTKEISPFGNDYFAQRYKVYSAREKEIIAFVKQHTNLPYPHKKDNYSIVEEENHYRIMIWLNGSSTNYRLHKVTGEITDFNELWASPAYMPNPLEVHDADTFYEIY